jgi:hypothetical protein
LGRDGTLKVGTEAGTGKRLMGVGAAGGRMGAEVAAARIAGTGDAGAEGGGGTGIGPAATAGTTLGTLAL